MTLNTTILIIIIGCAIVTILPRVIPFIVARRMEFPPIVVKLLSFIPVCIFTSLIVSSLLTKEAEVIVMHWEILFAIVPTIIVALWTKSLSISVIFGIVIMALIQFVS